MKKVQGFSNKKNLYIILLIFIVITIGILIWEYISIQVNHITSQTPQYTKLPSPNIDTSTWHTYTDSVLKYSIKYPSNIKIANGSHEGFYVDFSFVDADFSKLSASNPNVENLYITPLAGRKDPTCIPGTGCNNDTRTYKWIVINNAYGLDQSTFHNSSYSQFYVNDINKKNTAIFIQLIVSQKFDIKKVETLEQMIRTFQFNR